MSSLKAFAREARRNAAPEPPKKNAVRGTMSSHLSAERVQDSSEEEEEEESDEDSSSDDEPAPRKQAVTLSKVNGNSASKVAETEESDSKDSDSDSTDSSAPAKPVVAAPKTNGKVTSKEVGAKKTDSSTSDSSSSSSSGDGESSEESEEEAATPSMKKNPSVAEPASRQPKGPKTVSFTKPEQFVPPSGFKLQSISESTKASQLLNKSNLKGKQIWYITAPASVSMEAIETMSWPGDIQKNAVISFNGTDYGFVQGTDEAKASTKFMVPHSSDDGYRPGSKGIDNILHLQQVVKLPNTNKENAAPRATIPAKKPVRQQPKGLKMRFKPSGFGDGEAGQIGSSSDDDDGIPVAPVRFRKPESLSVDSGGEGSESSSSSEDDSSSSSGSSSDVEMADAPIAHTPKQNKAAQKSTTILPPTVSALKRKHTHETPEKNSSSRSQNTTNTPVLNSVKKPTESQNQLADSPLASTETNKTKTKGSIPPPKRVKPNKTVNTILPHLLSSAQRESPIPPPPSTQKKTTSVARSSSSSSIQPNIKQSPIPPPATLARPLARESPIPLPSSSLPVPKSSAILPPMSSKSKSTTTPATSSPLLQKKETVNQVSIPASVKNTPILPPMLRTMSSQASMSSAMGTPTPKKKKHKDKSEKSKRKSEAD